MIDIDNITLDELLEKYKCYITTISEDSQKEYEDKRLLKQKQDTEKVILYLKYFFPKVEKLIYTSLYQGYSEIVIEDIPECLERYYFGMDNLTLPNGLEIRNPFADIKEMFEEKKFSFYITRISDVDSGKTIPNKMRISWYEDK